MKQYKKLLAVFAAAMLCRVQRRFHLRRTGHGIQLILSIRTYGGIRARARGDLTRYRQ